MISFIREKCIVYGDVFYFGDLFIAKEISDIIEEYDQKTKTKITPNFDSIAGLTWSELMDLSDDRWSEVSDSDLTKLNSIVDTDRFEYLSEISFEYQLLRQLSTAFHLTKCERYTMVKLVTEVRKVGPLFLNENDTHTKRYHTPVTYVDIYYGRVGNFTTVLYITESQLGKKPRPVTVDTMVQIQSINEINLNEEYFDATIALSMRWEDKRLRWQPAAFGNVRTIKALREEVWIPELSIVNRVHDFSAIDEKVPKGEFLCS